MARWLTHTGPELLEPTKMIYEIDIGKDTTIENIPMYSGNILVVNISDEDKINIMKLVDMNYDVILKFINYESDLYGYYSNVMAHFIYKGDASSFGDSSKYTKEKDNMFYVFDSITNGVMIISAELRQDGTFVAFPGGV